MLVTGFTNDVFTVKEISLAFTSMTSYGFNDKNVLTDDGLMFTNIMLAIGEVDGINYGIYEALNLIYNEKTGID